MTGIGTQTDPYIIENWADFFNISDASAYYKLGCNLDANDYNGGVWTTCTLSCTELDGDGHAVWNINNTSTTDNRHAFDIRSNCNIKRLIIKQGLQTAAISTEYGFFAGNINNSKNFENCKFEIKSPYIFQTGSASGSYNFAGCILTFDGNEMTTSPNYQKVNVERCDIYLNMRDVSSEYSGFASITGCAFAGIINSSSSNISFGSGTGKVSSGIFSIKSNVPVKVNGIETSLSLVNSDLCPSANGAGIKTATTAQLMSSAWLDANGYTVIAK